MLLPLLLHRGRHFRRARRKELGSRRRRRRLRLNRLARTLLVSILLVSVAGGSHLERLPARDVLAGEAHLSRLMFALVALVLLQTDNKGKIMSWNPNQQQKLRYTKSKRYLRSTLPTC